MKLQKFDYEMRDNAKINRASKIIIALVALIAGFVIYKTYALFQKTTTSINIAKGVVGSLVEPTIVSGDLDTVGSEVCFDDQCFYVIGDDEDDPTKVKLLAKYNLLVGGKYVNYEDKTSCEADGHTWITDGDYCDAPKLIKTYTNDETGYGLQSEMVKGWESDTEDYIGMTPFSSTIYWEDENEKLLSKYDDDSHGGSTYGKNYPAYVYDNNSYIYTYVENYKNTLETKYGVDVNEARLIDYWEMKEELGCYDDTCGDAPEFMFSVPYWTGSVIDEGTIVITSSNGDYIVERNNPFYSCVRPVIVVDKSIFFKPEIVGENCTYNDIGCEIAIGSEHFYVIEDDTDDGSVTMLAKYNLLVGYKDGNNTSLGMFTDGIDEGYGLQSSIGYGCKTYRIDMYDNDSKMYNLLNKTSVFNSLTENQISAIHDIVCDEEADKYEGVVKFDEDYQNYIGYWVDSQKKLLPAYGEGYPAWVYDNNASIYNYLYDYEGVMIEYFGVNVSETRLIKLEELKNLGCSDSRCYTNEVINNGRTWIFDTSYWTGTANRYDMVLSVNTLAQIYDQYPTNITLGVRPVITVPASIFE